MIKATCENGTLTISLDGSMATLCLDTVLILHAIHKSLGNDKDAAEEYKHVMTELFKVETFFTDEDPVDELFEASLDTSDKPN